MRLYVPKPEVLERQVDAACRDAAALTISPDID